MANPILGLLLVLALTSGVIPSQIICVHSPESQYLFSNCNINSTLENLTKEMEIHPDLMQPNTTFIFDRGPHHMTAELSISDVSNVVLASASGSTKSMIQCSSGNAAAGVIFTDVRNINISYLSFNGCHAEEAVLTFHRGANVWLHHVHIKGSIGAGIRCTNVQGSTDLIGVSVVSSSHGNSFLYNKTSGNLGISSSVFADKPKMPYFTGYALNFTSNDSIAKIKIENSAISNNSGGNLAIVIVGIVSKKQVIIRHCNLTEGVGKHGGGLYLRMYEIPSPHQYNQEVDVVAMDSVRFENNQANVSGGLFMQLRNHPNVKKSKILSINNCSFINNRLISDLRGGAALHSINYILKGTSTQFSPQYKPKLSGCIFMNNHVENQSVEASGNGVIFINKHKYFGIRNTRIIGNNCSAILAVTSNLIFQGHNVLSHNQAASGGGILLCKNGILYFTPNTKLDITNNTAAHTGGGICVESQCLQTQPRCFYQFDDSVRNMSQLKSIEVKVSNNMADHAGENLFGGPVDYCYMIDDDNNLYNMGSNASLQIYNDIFRIPPNSPKHVSSITSIARRVCWCDSSTNQTYNCSIPHPKLLHFQRFSGEPFNVSVVALGQLYGYMSGTVKAEWKEGPVEILHSEESQAIGVNCAKLQYTPRSEKEGNYILQLSAEYAGDISGYLKLRSSIPLNLTVEIQQCPIGFTWSNNTCTCYNFTKGVTCSISDHTIIKDETCRTWIGVYNSQLASHPSCPYDYCKTQKVSINITNNKQLDEEAQCRNNRTGLLCGKCQPGLSMVLGGSECRECTSQLYLILLFAIAGFLLVFLLTALNLTIAEGMLGGLIFYANMVHYNHALLDKDSSSHSPLLKTLNVFIAWLNLDLGIPTCFYDGMDTYQKAWLQFLFPVYIWVLSIVIILLSKKSQIVATLASKNAVKVLATLVLLSYTKFTQASVRAFTCATLTCHVNGTLQQCGPLLWLEDGDTEYFGRKHLVLFGFGVLFGAVSLPFALVLLCIKPLHSVSHRKPFRWIQRLKPFLDAFTGPHTDHARFWPGLLLIVRTILSTIGGIRITGLESTNVKILSSILTVVILFTISKFIKHGLYTNASLDKLEATFLLNLAFLYLVSIFNFRTHLHWYKWLVGLVFLTFVGIVMHHIWLKIRHYKHMLMIVEKVTSIVRKLREKKERVNNLAHFPPYVQYTEDREPLLADMN